MGKRIYYPKFKHDTAVLAEQKQDGDWDIESLYSDTRLGDDEMFSQFFVPDAGVTFRDQHGEQYAVDPNQLLADGTHMATIIRDRESLYNFWNEHPDAIMFETEFGGVFVKGDLPYMWGGFVNPGESLTSEKNEIYFFPYFALTPNS